MSRDRSKRSYGTSTQTRDHTYYILYKEVALIRWRQENGLLRYTPFLPLAAPLAIQSYVTWGKCPQIKDISAPLPRRPSHSLPNGRRVRILSIIWVGGYRA